ncbi:TIGR00730 family Rossman fold protein [Candidatus Saccharibacteria bacterium]|nr:TIGR00730 family Rossman fold protein [Candidatus Saccharibacteria bacterium]
MKSAEDSLVGVVREFDRAFEILEKYPKTVSIFGSARLTEENPSYIDARNVAGILADQGFAVVTGGGGGIMEAANRGAFEAGGGSIGLNIILPNEQKLNEYTTDNFAFEHFFARKVALTLEASAYVFFAGGYGTLDELFEITTLIQTGDIDRRPIILFGSEFWGPLLDFIKNTLVDKFQTISNEDNDLFIVIDEYEQIISLLLK